MKIPENYTKNLNDLSNKDKLFVLDYLEKNYTAEIFFNQEIMTVIKNIFYDMSLIYGSLEILKKAGIDYTLTLVGGALRDLLTDNYESIKDLDIVLSINNVEQYSINKEGSLINNIEDNESIKQYVDYCKEKYKEWEYWNIDKKVAALIESVLIKNINIKQTYIPLELPKDMKDNGIFRSNYHNLFLRGVIKLEDKLLQYPADILICNATAEDYVNTFDFNICKIMLAISADQYREMCLNFNWDMLETIKNQIIPTNDFWIDLAYKRLTLNPIGFDMNALERSIVDHLPRIQKKYPDHTLILTQYNDSQLINEEVSLYLSKMDEFISLGERLPTKEDSKRIKPKKI